MAKNERDFRRFKSLVLVDGYTQLVSGPTRCDALLDIYLLRSKSSLIACNILPVVSEHNGFLLDIE